MFTRCDHCRAVLPLKVIDLAQAGGAVRCGSCGRTINALSNLYRDPPDDQSSPVESSGMPPLLQPRVAQEELGVASGRDDDAGSRGPELHLDLEPEPGPPWMRAVWPMLAVALAALLGLQFFGPPGWRADVAFPGFGDSEPVALEDALQLVSRDLHAHPSLSDAVVISAVVVNRSGQVVPWPNIDLKLFDGSQQVVGQRRIGPVDYLSEDADRNGGLGPGVRLPLVFEMVVDSSRPAGFSITFYPH